MSANIAYTEDGKKSLKGPIYEIMSEGKLICPARTQLTQVGQAQRYPTYHTTRLQEVFIKKIASVPLFPCPFSPRSPLQKS